MKLYNFIIVFLILVSLSITAQPINNLFQDIVPPSADAFAFGRILESEANSFTGAAHTNIPLYTIQNNKLSWPISMSYNGSGVRVNDPAGFIGTGWSLNAGGMISRSVLGIPDENNNGRLKKFRNLTVNAIADGAQDGEADIFSYSFGGYSGKFIIEPQGPRGLEVTQMPYTDLKIIPNSEDLDEFLIIDPEGNRYIFGSTSGVAYYGYTNFGNNGVQPIPLTDDTAQNKSTQNKSTNSRQRVEWYLRKIESVNGFDELLFTYQSNNYGLLMPGSQEWGNYRIITGNVCSGGTFLNPWTCNNTDGGLQVSNSIRNKGGALSFITGNDSRFGAPLHYNQIAYESKVIQKIEDQKGTTVNFILSTEHRKDYSKFNFADEAGTVASQPSNVFALDRIEIEEGSFDQEIKFNYDYFKSRPTPKYTFDYRLKLNSIQRTSFDGNENPYVFQYYNKAGVNSYSYLPWRLSKAIDKYGFYNGETDNNDLLYNIESNTLTAIVQGGSNIVVPFEGNVNSVQDADRGSATGDVQRIGSLQSITYPTKGTIVYDLEANTVLGGSDPVDMMICNLPNGGLPPAPCLDTRNTGCIDLPDLDAQGTIQEKNFTLTQQILDSYIQLFGEVVCSGPEQVVSDQNSRTSCDRIGTIAIELENSNNVNIFRETISIGGCLYSPTDKIPFDQLFGNLSSYLNQNLKLKVIGGNSEFLIRFFERVNPRVSAPTGGVRVKAITWKDINNTTVKEVDYRYDTPLDDNFNDINGTGESSGTLMVEPLHEYISYSQGDVNAPDINSLNYNALTIRFTSGGTYPNANFNGHHIAYKRIRKSIDGGGFTVYQNSPQIVELDDVVEQYPFVPFDYFPANGITDVVRHFDENGAMVSRTELSTQTLTHQTSSLSNYRVKPYANSSTVHYLVSVYKNEGKFARTSQKLDVFIFDEKEFETLTSFAYPSPEVTIQPQTVTVTNSDGRKHQSVSFYYDTFTSTIAGINASRIQDEMEARNILTPWRTFTRVSKENGTNLVNVDGSSIQYAFFKLSGGRLILDSNNTITNPLLPYNVDRAEVSISASDAVGSINWQDQYTINEYNNIGLPTKVLLDGWDIAQEYNWDSSGNLLSSTYDDYVKSYTYYTDSDLLKTTTNIDGTSAMFEYDKLQRLTKSVDDQRGIETTIGYHFSSGSNNKNHKKITTTYPKLGDQTNFDLVDYVFYDGFSRELLVKKIKQASNNTKTLVLNKTYDAVGRLSQEYEAREVSSINSAFINPSGTSTKYFYDNSPLNRMVKVTDPSNLDVTMEYGTTTSQVLDYSANTLRYEKTLDGNLIENTNYFDRVGNLVGVKKGKGSDVTLTKNIYDRKNRLIEIMPNTMVAGLESYKYTYTGNDLVATKKVPNTGIEEFTYNHRDQLTISQNARMRQWGPNVVLLNAYDKYGNHTHQGITTTGAGPITNPEFNYEYQGAIGLMQREFYSAETSDPFYVSSAVKGKLGKLAREISVLTEVGGYEYAAVLNYDYDSSGRVTEIGDDTRNLSVSVDIPYFFRTGETTGIRTEQNKQYRIKLDGELEQLEPLARMSTGNCDYNTPTIRYKYDSADNITHKSLEVCYHTLASIDGQIKYQKINHIDFAGRPAGESIDLAMEDGDFDGDFSRLSELNYNGKGQLSLKRIGEISNDGSLQKINYTYRQNGDLSKINSTSGDNNNGDDLMMNIDYTYYANRNIKTTDFYYKYGLDRKTKYIYDGLNRIKESNDANSNLIYTQYSYSDNNLGDLKTIKRNNTFNQTIDDLDFSYLGNTSKLSTITDAAGTVSPPTSDSDGYDFDGFTEGDGNYQYDTQGNVIYDPSRDVTIDYDFRNLPVQYAFGNGNRINIQYKLDGSIYKRDQYTNNTLQSTRIYFDDMQFLDGKIDLINFSDGFLKTNVTCENGVANSLSLSGNEFQKDMTYLANDITSDAKLQTGKIEYIASEQIILNKSFTTSDNSFLANIEDNTTCDNAIEDQKLVPFYNLKDHLGNTRLVFSNFDTSLFIEPSEIVSEYHYYPFGMEMKGFADDTNLNYDNFYNGKELIDDFDLGYYNYGARFYDPAIGRFTGVDPISDKFPHVSTYNYAENNPISNIDPDGRMAVPFQESGPDDWVKDKNGNIYWDQNATSQATTKAGETYLGKAAVVFEGSRSEQLGKGDNINGTGATTAKVTAYGPGGSTDVQTYKGFTMTSDAAKFTPIDDGEYTATYRTSSGSGSLPKHFQMFESGKDNLRTLDGKLNNNSPSQVRANGDGFKTEIFIHRTNNSGFAGRTVSTGCLLLCPSDYKSFESQLKPVGVGVSFPVIVKR